MPEEVNDNEKELPIFSLILLLILIPLVLILVNTVSNVILTEGSLEHEILTFIGHPFVALTITVLLTFYFLGIKRGYSKEDVQNMATKSLEPAGDRKSTRLNSSHVAISYAVFGLTQ